MEHPSVHELEAYCNGKSGDTVTAEIERHLVDCSECAWRVAQTVRVLLDRSGATVCSRVGKWDMADLEPNASNE